MPSGYGRIAAPAPSCPVRPCKEGTAIPPRTAALAASRVRPACRACRRRRGATGRCGSCTVTPSARTSRSQAIITRRCPGSIWPNSGHKAGHPAVPGLGSCPSTTCPWLTMAATLPGRLLSTKVSSAASIIVPCGIVWPGCVILGAGGFFRARACAQKSEGFRRSAGVSLLIGHRPGKCRFQETPQMKPTPLGQS